jgi:hypothetical protein
MVAKDFSPTIDFLLLLRSQVRGEHRPEHTLECTSGMGWAIVSRFGEVIDLVQEEIKFCGGRLFHHGFSIE